MNDENRTPPPADPQRFFAAADDFAALQEPPVPPDESALERLGPSPFPKSRFPFLGLLATIYDHVAEHARGRTQSGLGEAGDQR